MSEPATTSRAAGAELGFDPEALRDKYRRERDKRLRTDGILADYRKMESIRARVDAIVADKTTAEALKPYYNQFCKRPCFHDEYLQTFNRPNVTLVDTGGNGVERITPEGVIDAGREYKLDCLIFAIGFEVGTAYTQRAGYNIIGRGGLGLMKKWQDGMLSLHGMHVHGFPNGFIMSTLQAGFTANYPHALNEQSKHIAHIIAHAQREGADMVEATEEAERAWRRTILELILDRRKFQEEWAPGYYNNEGQASPLAASYAPYGAGSMAFFKVLEEWCANSELRGLHISKKTRGDVPFLPHSPSAVHQ